MREHLQQAGHLLISTGQNAAAAMRDWHGWPLVTERSGFRHLDHPGPGAITAEPGALTICAIPAATTTLSPKQHQSTPNHQLADAVGQAMASVIPSGSRS